MNRFLWGVWVGLLVYPAIKGDFAASWEVLYGSVLCAFALAGAWRVNRWLCRSLATLQTM